MEENGVNLLSDRLRKGDFKAYERVMDEYYRPLCTYAYMLSKDHAMAEDIVQNVMLTLWERRKKINPTLSLKNLLYTSVYNGFIDTYRKDKPVIYLEKKYLEAIDIVVEEKPEQLQDLMLTVQREIDKLPPKCRTIFLLNKKEGLTHVEISQHLNISVKTIEGHITRAFKILEEKLSSSSKPILFVLYGVR